MENRDREPQYYADIIAAMAERTIKRLWVALIVAYLLIAGIVAGFLWHLNQYDFESYEISTDGGGYASYVGQNGNIYNGAGSSTETR